MHDDKTRAKNLRLALILAAVAVAIFVGFLVKQGMLGK
ncbi:MAG: cytochrome oxidase small assembly protein [Pseudomonadota bacterium]